MFLIARYLTILVVCTLFVQGYMAVSSLKGVSEKIAKTTARMSYGTVDNHTLLVFDAVEPSTGSPDIATNQ